MNEQVNIEKPKSASASVVAQYATTVATLPFSDTRDFDDASRGFMGSREHANVVAENGRIVWSLEQYKFLVGEKAPATVNPSLWRQSQLNMHHGLFEVVPGVYQVRGFDIANMTLIEGDTGVIVVDTLTTIEAARTAMALYFEHRGQRPVAAVVFTHTHMDHWGGAHGVLDDDTLASGRVPVIAPDLFMENAVSENIIVGPAMLRRAQYQFGPLLAKGPRGQVDCGLGKAGGGGKYALLRPTDLIKATGDKRVIDGVEFEFQMAPNSEAPAEMHFYTPRYIPDIRLILGVLGHLVLEPLDTQTTTTATVGSSEPVGSLVGREFVFGTSSFAAKGRVTDEGFLIIKGSKAAPKFTVGNAGYDRLRQKLLQDGTLKAEGEHLIFTKDYSANSASQAASVVAGGNRSGPESWKSDGKSLGEIEAASVAEPEPGG